MPHKEHYISRHQFHLTNHTEVRNMKKILSTTILLATLTLSFNATAADLGDKIIFSECKDGLAAPGVDPRTTPANDCWNPDKGPMTRPAMPTAPAMPNHPMAMARDPMRMPNAPMMARMNRPDMTMAAPAAAMAPPKAPTRSLRLLTVNGAQFIESEHNPVCYTLNFSGRFYQFCF